MLFHFMFLVVEQSLFDASPPYYLLSLLLEIRSIVATMSVQKYVKSARMVPMIRHDQVVCPVYRSSPILKAVVDDGRIVSKQLCWCSFGSAAHR